MKYKNEAEIMRALGIDTWRHLSKEKAVRFAAMMPDMDTEVAMKIVEQFPEFRKFATDAFGAIEKAHEATLADGRHSLDQVYQALRANREIFERELHRGDLTWEQRKHLLELIQETARLASQKDTEHKRHVDGLLKKAMVGVGSALALGVVFVGGRILVQGKEEPDDSEES
ncbi:hypothetical protein ACFWR9_30735 [Streptomyces sp. NPDC058534]|uniref:hypothetical protein n=1 Tax=Streptomyces sp. NPDC058534 TaxID=3346541 RepID=UPI00364B1119